MANTITYDPTPADQPEFTEEEQANLAVGEQLEEQQNQLLAGKFKDAESLESAYIELQKKLGSNEPTDEAPAEEAEEQSEEKPDEDSAPVALISNASEEYAEKGELSPETMEQFSQMSSQDLVKAYIEMQGEAPTAQPAADLSEAEVNQIKNEVGGDEAYTNLVTWAGENLDQKLSEGFDQIISSGNVEAIRLAVAGLKSEYENSNGYEGRMLTGKNAAPADPGFRSQAEVVEAMKDPRYDSDPAYRQDVFTKLERSNINY